MNRLNHQTAQVLENAFMQQPNTSLITITEWQNSSKTRLYNKLIARKCNYMFVVFEFFGCLIFEFACISLHVMRSFFSTLVLELDTPFIFYTEIGNGHYWKATLWSSIVSQSFPFARDGFPTLFQGIHWFKP